MLKSMLAASPGIVLFVVLAVATPCLGQTKTTVTPPGYDTVAGGAASTYFGGFRDARMQYTETFLTGKGTKLITKVGYRRAQVSTTSVARTWSRVTLHCCETSYAANSSTFSMNQLTTPVRVFSAGVTFPIAKGAPPSNPAKFLTSYAFPFKKPWSYSGKRDVALDYVFAGGNLASGHIWRSSVWVNYSLDAPPSRAATIATMYQVASGCTDSGHTFQGYVLPNVRVYPKTGGTAATNNTLAFFMYSGATAKSATVIQAIDFAANNLGTPLAGVTCSKLYLAASSSMLLFSGSANDAGYRRTTFSPIPWNPLFAGTTVWTQALWHDSWTKQPLLSLAGKTTVPKQGPPQLSRTCVYQFQKHLMNSYGYVYRDEFANPLVRWSY